MNARGDAWLAPFRRERVRWVQQTPAPPDRAFPADLQELFPAAEFATARAEIAAWDGYAPTPLRLLGGLAHRLELGSVLYKDEAFRFGLESFKALGGAYAVQRVLQREIADRTGAPVSLADVRERRHANAARDITVVTASDGNHGRSVAWGAQRFGCACKIYLHHRVSEGRADAIRNFGAQVVRVEGTYDDSVQEAALQAEANGWRVVADTAYEGYVDVPRDVMAGYATITAEVLEQVSPEEPPTHLFVQGGVGGLAAALAAHLWQALGPRRPVVVVVEPAWADALIRSARRGRRTSMRIRRETVMAGLSCGKVSTIAWPVLAKAATHFLAIEDEFVAPTMRLLAAAPFGDPAIVAGESGVPGMSALVAVCVRPDMRRAIGLDASSRVLLIGTEGATDPAIYRDLTGRNPEAVALRP